MSGKILMNHDVLLPEHLPRKLLFRDAEYDELVAGVRNRVSMLLVGPVGSGKTSLVKILQREIGYDNLFYIDCLVHDTEYSVLKEIVPSVRAAFIRSSFELVKELKRISQGRRLTVCFDNFVRLRDMQVVEKVMALGITAILIASVERDLNLLSANAVPKLTRIVKLRNYTVEQAYKIIRARAEQGLAADSYDDATLKSILAATDGNITLGINILRAAALKAEAEGRSNILPEDLSNLLPKHKEDLELTEDERVITKILREKLSVEHKQLYNLYCQAVRAPKQERTFRNYMQRLIGKSLVWLELSDGLRMYKVVEHE